MLLYHGSNLVVEKPKILTPNRYLDFVSEHRNGTAKEDDHDLIRGPVADDDIFRTFILYSSGVLSKEQTLDALKIKKLFDQYVFASEKAIGLLKFIGTKG